MKVLSNETDIRDFVWGCAFFGTGGGGDPHEGIDLLLRAAEAGLELNWVGRDYLPPDWVAVCPFGMGSIAPISEEAMRAREAHGLGRRSVDDPLAEAVKVLAKAIGVNPRVVIPLELGGWNTPAAVVCAARLGLAVADGDYAGRAVPEITQCIPAIEGIPFWPGSAVDDWGNATVILSATGNAMAERIGKMLSVASFGGVAMAGFAMRFDRAASLMVAGSLTRCLRVGRLIREAANTPDPVLTVARGTGARLLLRGLVVEKSWEDRDGYYWGQYKVTGRSHDGADECVVWFKNESHVAWLNGVPVVTSPDLIVALGPDGYPLTNPEIQVGSDVAVLALPAAASLRSLRAAEVLGPRHFGFDFGPAWVGQGGIEDAAPQDSAG